MTVAVYDNPATCCREGWQDGRMLGSVSANLMASRGFRESGRMPWWLHVGDWTAGKVVGERLAVRALNPPLGHP